MQFIIRDPYPGWAETFITPAGVAAYTQGETPEAYIARRSDTKLRIVTEEELHRIDEAHISAMVTDPREISAEKFDEALCCLPPDRYHTAGGVEMFHISERITGDLVSWWGNIDGRYFTFNDRAGRFSTELADKFKGAL